MSVMRAAGAGAAATGRLVTFGITPDRPETGYGYLELDAVPEAGAAPAALPVRRFVEKPDGLDGGLFPTCAS